MGTKIRAIQRSMSTRKHVCMFRCRQKLGSEAQQCTQTAETSSACQGTGTTFPCFLSLWRREVSDSHPTRNSKCVRSWCRRKTWHGLLKGSAKISSLGLYATLDKNESRFCWELHFNVKFLITWTKLWNCEKKAEHWEKMSYED